jgi:hypothetical protein
MRPAPPMLKAVVVGSCGVSLFLGACGIANTPQQDLAYTRWAKCNASLFPLELERVDLDGRITFRFSPNSQDVLLCLTEAGRIGPPLPEPVGVCPPKGP